MATLTKTREEDLFDDYNDDDELMDGVPAPFPRGSIPLPPGLAPVPVPAEKVEGNGNAEAGPSTATVTIEEEQAREREEEMELDPSIALVQRSCISTLNNLLAPPPTSTTTATKGWEPIIPMTRRHSVPAYQNQQQQQQESGSGSATDALRVLVGNLRNVQAGTSEMVEARVDVLQSGDRLGMLDEVARRLVGMGSGTQMQEGDRELAGAIVRLLTRLERLGAMEMTLPQSTGTGTEMPPMLGEEADLLATLSHFQRTTSQSGTGTSEIAGKPVQRVEAALVWNDVEHQLDSVLSLCRERLPPQYTYSPPSQYAHLSFADDEKLPDYDARRSSLSESASMSDRKSVLSQATYSSRTEEKTRMDLESIALAIDRLYLVAPQLHNQRVELREGKLREMERARAKDKSKGKGKDIGAMLGGAEKEKRDVRELEGILDMIGRASERKIADQSFVVDTSPGGVERRRERERRREEEEKATFIQTLARHSTAGRLHAQDYTHSSTSLRASTTDRDRERDKEMLTLPEFIREALPRSVERRRYEEQVLSLPEFVREPPPPPSSSANSTPTPKANGTGTGHKTSLSVGVPMEKTSSLGSSLGKRASMRLVKRSRSSSSPGSAAGSGLGGRWLGGRAVGAGGTGEREVNGHGGGAINSNSKPKPKSKLGPTAPTADKEEDKTTPEVQLLAYLAEAHPTLSSVLVFVRLSRATPGYLSNALSASVESDKMDILIGAELVDVRLPVGSGCVSGPGWTVLERMPGGEGWWEGKVRMGTRVEVEGEDEDGEEEGDGDGEDVWDAERLSKIQPSSFLCSGSGPGCGATLLSTPTSPSSLQDDNGDSKGLRYADLPSPHFQELLEHMICHAPSQSSLSPLLTSRAGGREGEGGGGGGGFVPREREMYVGTGFVFVHPGMVVEGGVVVDEEQGKHAYEVADPYLPMNENTRAALVRCRKCGEAVGRRIELDGDEKTVVYRMWKYAMDPVLPSVAGESGTKMGKASPSLEALLVSEMQSHVDTRACHRFVLVDEESDRGTVLMWLFKPSLRVSYLSTGNEGRKKETIRAAKVLFKVLDPPAPVVAGEGELDAILTQYPLFPSAEHLYYPLGACERVKRALRESSELYPEGMREMMRMEVGLLRRG